MRTVFTLGASSLAFQEEEICRVGTARISTVFESFFFGFATLFIIFQFLKIGL